MITKEISLKLWGKNEEIFYAVKGEVDARRMKVCFLDKDETNLNLSGKTVTFYAQKPDGTQVYSNCTINTSENSATVDVTSQMVSVLGIVECEFQIFDSENELLKANGLRIIVTSKGDFTEAVESTSEFSALTTALNQVKNLPTDAVKDIKVNGKIIAKDSNKIVNITGIPTFEQGTWTPEISCPAGGVPTYTLIKNTSNFFRIDNLVYINFFMKVNITDPGQGVACIAGLPFQVKSGEGRHSILLNLKGCFDPADTVVIATAGSHSLKFTSYIGEYWSWKTGEFFISGSGCYLGEL